MALLLANVLALVSVLLSALFLFGMCLAGRFIALTRAFMAGPGLGGVVAIRLLLAALLWLSAPVSSTPLAFRVLALLMCVGAFSALVLGTDRVVALIDRMDAGPTVAVRLPCAVGFAFGVFMLWSISSAIGVF